MLQAKTIAITLLLLTTGLAGCVGLGDDLDQNAVDLTRAYDTSRGWSQPLTPALYDILEGVEKRVPSFDGTEISLGIFLPDIEGCDWAAAELPAECELPVLMDAGPYYGANVDRDKYRPPWIEWLVPRGYAVVQMSVRGTGESAGCMEFLSMNSSKDVDAMVTWLAEQAWSNGNIAMGGRSYDGTTPLMAAALGNPHLKTIIPISSVPDFKDLMYKNGTSEFRGPIMHSYVYWVNYGVSPGAAYRMPHATEQACEETIVGQVEGTYATATGETGGFANEQYWADRDFAQGILDNYKGSIWIVHGLEDWNVNPSQVVPWINELQDAGIETRAWLGQWAHAYPDRMDEHRNVRWDWAQETLEWLDFYLKGEGDQPPLNVEVEDSLYVWRVEESYPPRDITWERIELPGMGGATVGTPSVAGTMGTGSVVGTTDALDQDMRIVGLPQVRFTATPTTPTGNHLFAELYDVFPDGRSVRIGWGALNLNHHDGGNDEAEPLTPGMAYETGIEFEPLDAHVGEGHRLRIVIHQDGVEDVLPSPDPSPVMISDVALRLSTVDRTTTLPGYEAPGLSGLPTLVE